MSHYGEISLDHLLEAQLDLYDQGYRVAWGIDADAPPNGVSREDWILANDLSQVAGAILSSARPLDVSPALREYVRHMRPGDPIRPAMSDLASYNVAADRIAIDLASRAVLRKLFPA